MSFVDSRICRRLVCGSSICSIRICAACTPSANVSTSTLVMGVSASSVSGVLSQLMMPNCSGTRSPN